MPTSIRFAIICRAACMLLILATALCLGVGTFPYKSVFVGLAFPHFFLGAFYSKRNIPLLRRKRHALLLATIIIIVGLYFSMNMPFVAPYFLVVHAALSDAYLLPLPSRLKDSEHMKLLKTTLYVACFSLLFLSLSPTLAACAAVVGVACLATICVHTEDRKSLALFELPLLLVVLYTQVNGLGLDIHFLGFYHVSTWYAFSLWMLLIKEKNPKKTVSFFSMVLALAVFFVFLFEVVLGLSITAVGFKRVVAFWSILHISSSIPLSKFNPRILKDRFYPGRPGKAWDTATHLSSPGAGAQ